ncbi:MAG: hypothetical protein EKK42_29185 [Pseudonocardiaceae bacterium]|nr:MAG: hypothetical protein EKK42_29185 [Pseudonocardiaceae bacterium]
MAGRRHGDGGRRSRRGAPHAEPARSAAAPPPRRRRLGWLARPPRVPHCRRAPRGPPCHRCRHQF